MLAVVRSATCLGVNGQPCAVEAHVIGGLPGFNIIGLPDTACREVRDRVRAALLSSGLSWPQTRITVNVAPTGIRKMSSSLDLPIALAVLAADELITLAKGSSAVGELGLNGDVRAVPGLIPMAETLDRPLVPKRQVEDMELFGPCVGVATLNEAIEILEATDE